MTQRPEEDDLPNPAAADPAWFRPPSRRERWIAAALFVGFGIFFVLLFVVSAGFWFRWVTLALAVISIFAGLGHARSALRARGDHG